MENNNCCISKICEKCTNKENPKCCLGFCNICNKCPITKILLFIIFIAIIFCLGLCIGKSKSDKYFRNSDHRVMYDAFKKNKNMFPDKPIIKTPVIPPELTQ